MVGLPSRLAGPSDTDDADGRSRLPAAACEIRKVHGSASAGDRFLAQLGDATPGAGVGHVDVRRRAGANRLDQAVQVHPVGAPVPAARRAFDRGIECILKCQIRVDGKLTAWCAQHDEKDYRPRPGRSYELVVQDAAAPPIWARFYEIGTNRPIFCDRDGVAKHSLGEIGYERRNGYAWLGYWPRALLEQDYPAWKERTAGARIR